MRFIIKPDDTTLNLMLEANQYRQLWARHSRKILRAFREVTGLDFQQRVITARVADISASMAGTPHIPMQLAGDARSPEYKLITMVHELSHRLLGGNALGPVALGLYEPDEAGEDTSEADHRHIYLFEYDVIQHALGDEWAAMCQEYEQRFPDTNAGHTKAWERAMGLTYEQRQQALRKLTAKAVTREHWAD